MSAPVSDADALFERRYRARIDKLAPDLTKREGVTGEEAGHLALQAARDLATILAGHLCELQARQEALMRELRDSFGRIYRGSPSALSRAIDDLLND